MRKIDSHTHVDAGRPEVLLARAREQFGYEKIAVMGIPCSNGPLNNLECLKVKALAPDYAYVYGGMVYSNLSKPDARDHEKQLTLLMDAGFDGWKLLESKPSCYRRLQLPLDGEVFARTFALAEAEQIPVTWHAGDPATFWSAETAPRFAVENGWLCVGEGFPTLVEIYRQVEAVLARHPRLRASLAHLYFTSDDRPHAERLLDTFECLALDLTPGNEMYVDFMKDPDGWRAFFRKYRGRLVFGTDMADEDEDVVFGGASTSVDLVTNTLAGSEPFRVWEISGQGLGLEEDVLRKVFAENFARIVPTAPKPISKSGLNAYAEWIQPHLTKEQRRSCEDMLREIIG